MSVVPENIHALPINVIFQGGGGSLMRDCLKGNVQVKFPIFPEIIGWWLANDCITFVYNNDAKKHCPKSLYPVFLEFLNWAIILEFLWGWGWDISAKKKLSRAEGWIFSGTQTQQLILLLWGSLRADKTKLLLNSVQTRV